MSSGLDGENKRLVELGEALRTCKMELPVATGSPLDAWHPYIQKWYVCLRIFEQKCKWHQDIWQTHLGWLEYRLRVSKNELRVALSGELYDWFGLGCIKSETGLSDLLRGRVSVWLEWDNHQLVYEVGYWKEHGGWKCGEWTRTLLKSQKLSSNVLFGTKGLGQPGIMM